jgi:hypothetical protein
LEEDDKATEEYIFPNQIEDANNIVSLFYNHKRYVISIQKKTKVGADGLMIEIAKIMTTHSDDRFVVNPKNVRIITGMSNAGWEKDMIDKAPTCFKCNIFHHGKLSKSDLKGMRNALIIIDEIDNGDKELQVLHTTLKEAGVLDVEYMKTFNIRFVFISATMIKELYHLYSWGELHELYNMTIPASYIGHRDFLAKGIVKEFYPLDTKENAEKWVQDDIITHYGDDYRVHLVRVTAKFVDVVQNACIRKSIVFRNHTSDDRLSEDEINEFFREPLTHHIVLGVKGFFRRANLIPNRWKLRVGATHELYTKKVDNNVQIQGLTGRMTGYWRDTIEGGHKTGPHRTSIKAIQEYEATYNDPFGTNSYQTSGFKKKNGKIVSDPTMISAHNIYNLEAVDLPELNGIPIKFVVTNKVTLSEISNFGRLINKKKFMTLLQKAKDDGNILLDDKNKVDSVRLPFSFNDYNIDTKRIMTDDKKAENYRLPQFMDHYTRRKAYGQSIQKGKFAMDLTTVDIELKDGEKIQAGTGFISFVYLPRPTSHPQLVDEEDEDEKDEKFKHLEPEVEEKAAQASGGSRDLTETELAKKKVPELREIAINLGLKPPSNMKKDELVQSILKKQAGK